MKDKNVLENVTLFADSVNSNFIVRKFIYELMDFTAHPLQEIHRNCCASSYIMLLNFI